MDDELYSRIEISKVSYGIIKIMIKGKTVKQIVY